MNILIHIICVYILYIYIYIVYLYIYTLYIYIYIVYLYIYIYLFKYTNSHQFLIVSYFDTEGETLIYLVFLCLVMCDFICCFFCDLSLWRSSFLCVPNFETPSQNRWNILGARPFLWLILRGVFVCE